MLYEGRNKQPMIATKPVKRKRKDNKRFEEIERALTKEATERFAKKVADGYFKERKAP